MCMLHTRQAHLWFIPDSLKSFLSFLNSLNFDAFCQCGWNLDVDLFVCVLSVSSLYFPVGSLATGRCGDTHKQAGRQSTALTGASIRSCHVTKRFRILATLRQETNVCTATHQDMYTAG